MRLGQFPKFDHLFMASQPILRLMFIALLWEGEPSKLKSAETWEINLGICEFLNFLKWNDPPS